MEAVRVLPAEPDAHDQHVAAVPRHDRRGGVQVHQFAASEIVAPVAEGEARLAVATEYPWDGRVAITVAETPEQPWTLSVRAPAWGGAGAAARDPRLASRARASISRSTCCRG